MVNVLINGLILVICLVVAFLLSFDFTKNWIGMARRNGILGKDMNKYDKREVSDFGGMMPIVAIITAIFVYIFFNTFVFKNSSQSTELFVIIITVIVASLIGFFNDVLSMKVTKDKEIFAEFLGRKGRGIGGWKRMLFTLPAAIPLVVMNAGIDIISLPILGQVWIGLAYPLVVVTIAVVGATNGFNLLAGYNGLETGFGIIMFAGFGVLALATGQPWLALIAAIAILALIGFLIFNKFPAKVFPGDSLTFGIGALVACFAVFGNMEQFALFLFIPFIIEGFLKWRSKFKAQNFGRPTKDGYLEPKSKKIYSLTHFFLRFIKKIKPNHKVRETDVVWALWTLEILLVIIGILLVI
ncbi:MAG: hypothetical protein JSW08_03750 [archaeon]|nr:MAG: hypothetical protein JSW08_03750 [archaeon]